MTVLRISMSKQTAEGMWLHPLLQTTATGDQLFCAQSHCKGQCGYPALFLREYVVQTGSTGDYYRKCAERGHDGFKIDEEDRVYVDYKAHGAMTACGPVWQVKKWDGERVYVEVEDVAVALKMWWW